MDEPLSNNQVARAGQHLRDFVRAGGRLEDIRGEHELERDLQVAQAFRKQFASPLVKVNVRVRQLLDDPLFSDVSNPAQRHKRLERIVQKLARPNSTKLDRIQDIAGLRVIVPSLEVAYQLNDRLRLQWRPGSESTEILEQYCRDYIARPKPNGYRAIHLIVRRDGRLVELQIRTQRQQFWAESVEQLSERLGVELKSQDGPDLVTEFMVQAGDVVARIDQGESVKETLTLTLDGETIMSITANT